MRALLSSPLRCFRCSSSGTGTCFAGGKHDGHDGLLHRRPCRNDRRSSGLDLEAGCSDQLGSSSWDRTAGSNRAILFLQDYRKADANILAPVSYLSLLVVTAAGYFLSNEVPDPRVMLGIAIILISLLSTAVLEQLDELREQGRSKRRRVRS